MMTCRSSRRSPRKARSAVLSFLGAEAMRRDATEDRFVGQRRSQPDERLSIASGTETWAKNRRQRIHFSTYIF